MRQSSIKRKTGRRTGAAICSLLMAAVLLTPVAGRTVSAAGDADTHTARLPDYSRTGSVTVDIQTAKGKAIPGGELTAYRVADAKDDNGNQVFVFTDDFAKFDADLSALDDETGSSDLADQAEAYVKQNNLKPLMTEPVDEDGMALFSDLKLGLYLIIQTESAENYAPINTFLVTVPMWDGEALEYDVNASPKAGTTEFIHPGVTLTPTPTPTVTPTPTESPPPKTPTPTVTSVPPTTTLMKTGQLWWPVPLLLAAGLLLTGLGSLLRQRGRHEY